MHTILESICNELDQITSQINSVIPSDEPFNIVHGNWGFPGITRNELSEAASSLSSLIQERGMDEIESNEVRLQDYVRRLAFVRTNMISNIWGNAAVAVPNYLATLDALKQAVEPVLKTDTGAARSIALITQTARAMEARLNELQPRSVNLLSMVERIEHAYEAADKLPIDLQALTESHQKILEMLKSAEKDRVAIEVELKRAEKYTSDLENSSEQAKTIADRCQSVYAAATSQGLAAAFSKRSKVLNDSIWFWVIGLVAALIMGSLFGSNQLHQLAELMKLRDVSTGTIAVNLILSLLSVGAPIWFGWLATKQIGQRFRLSEDYAFKASISQAYEGYRREAARIDKDMEARLLASALTRLDEQPLRLIETASHGSPWHEILSSDLIKEAVKTVPGFTNQVLDIAKTSLSTVKSNKTKLNESIKADNPD